MFVFLCAQYESWAMPVMVMPAIPLALLGAVAAAADPDDGPLHPGRGPAGAAGAASRQSLGTTVCGGMLLATVLSLAFVPVFDVVIQRMRECGRPEPRTPAEESGAPQPQAAE